MLSIPTAWGVDGTAEADGIMASKAPLFEQNLTLSIVRQWSEPYEASTAWPGSDSAPGADPHPAIALLDYLNITVDNELRGMLSPAPVRQATKTKNIDALALFTRFATVSTLSSAVAPEHGHLNRIIRSGSHPKLDELEAPTLDATGLRHVLRGVGLGVPNSMPVRPMLDEFGEVVGCQPRLTYAEFETLRVALIACGPACMVRQERFLTAVTKVQRAWRVWRARGEWHRAIMQAKMHFARKTPPVARNGQWSPVGTTCLALNLGCVAFEYEGACEGAEGINDGSLVAAPENGAKRDDRESAPPLPLETQVVG